MREKHQDGPRADPVGRARSLGLVAAAVVAGLLGAAAPASAAYVPADDGATLTSVTKVSDRIYDAQIKSPALNNTTAKVRLIVPTGWTGTGTQKFPVLYLLHGFGGKEQVDYWSQQTDVVAFTADKPVIVATPYGPGGVYADWEYPLTSFGPIDSEKFAVTEVPQLLERNLQASGKRAIGGMSTGGSAALSFSARYPGRYLAAGAFSGMLDITQPGNILTLMFVGFTNAGSPFAIWGDPVGSAPAWHAYNPIDLAAKLNGVALYLSSGTGQPGPLDTPGAGTNYTEARTEEDLIRFDARLKQLGVPATVDRYGPGSHSYRYWGFALKRGWPVFAKALGIGAGV